MTLQPCPGDWTDICEMLQKCQQPTSMVIPREPWKDSYLLVEGRNGTIVFRFSGYDIKSMDVSTKSRAELEEELNKTIM